MMKHTAATVPTLTSTISALANTGSPLKVRPPGAAGHVRVGAGREDIAKLIASGALAVPEHLLTASTTTSTPRSGLTTAEMEKVADLLRPVLRPKLERLEHLERLEAERATKSPAKGLRRPATGPSSRGDALARAEAVLARVAVAQARAIAALRMSR